MNEGTTTVSTLSTVFFLIIMFAVMYFTMIRPENKRKKQADEMRSNLKKGDVITTIGGIVGKIIMLNEETIIIETSDDRVRMELARWAVSVNNTQQAATKDAKKTEQGEKHTEPAEDK